MFSIAKFIRSNIDEIFYISLLCIVYLLELVFAVVTQGFLMPQLFVSAIFIIAIRHNISLWTLIIVSIFYDHLFTGYIGLSTIPLVICYHITIHYSYLRLDKQTTLIRCIFFAIYLLIYNLLYLGIFYFVMSSLRGIDPVYLIIQYVVTWSFQPFLYNFILYSYKRVIDGL